MDKLISREEANGVSQEYLREFYEYNESTGKLKRIKRLDGKAGNSSYVGKDNWSTNKRGYSKIRVKKKLYDLHRIVWVYNYGYIPVGRVIDHIDRNPTNNKIDNLRLVTTHENGVNKKPGVSGTVGVVWSKPHNLWVARIRIGRKRVCLGYYHDIEGAIEARQMAERIKYFYRRINVF